MSEGYPSSFPNLKSSFQQECWAPSPWPSLPSHKFLGQKLSYNLAQCWARGGQKPRLELIINLCTSWLNWLILTRLQKPDSSDFWFHHPKLINIKFWGKVAVITSVVNLFKSLFNEIQSFNYIFKWTKQFSIKANTQTWLPFGNENLIYHIWFRYY